MTTASSRPVLRLASGVDLAEAIDAFLLQTDLAETTRARYRQTPAVIERARRRARTGTGLAGVVEQHWHHASPATCKPPRRDRQIVCALLLAHSDPRDQRRCRAAAPRRKHDHTRSIPLASLERLWERRDLDLRERTLWRVLSETAARADEVLRLNIEDLDILGNRARARSESGDVDWLFFGSGTRGCCHA